MVHHEASFNVLQLNEIPGDFHRRVNARLGDCLHLEYRTFRRRFVLFHVHLAHQFHPVEYFREIPTAVRRSIELITKFFGDADLVGGQIFTIGGEKVLSKNFDLMKEDTKTPFF